MAWGLRAAGVGVGRDLNKVAVVMVSPLWKMVRGGGAWAGVQFPGIAV